MLTRLEVLTRGSDLAGKSTIFRGQRAKIRGEPDSLRLRAVRWIWFLAAPSPWRPPAAAATASYHLHP